MRKFDDWEHIQRVCVLVSSENLLEIKRASHTFRRDANREYDRRMRELNKLTQSPINFAFTADYTDDSVPKCPFCRTYLFPQETSKKMWCCGGGKMLELYRPWSQPTDDFRNHCTGDFANAKLFRSESRRLNMTFAFAAYGIKYGQVDSSRKPPYFLKINGIPYYRILTVGNETDEPTNPLHMYMYDSQYNQPGEKKPLPDTLRTIVKNCMLQCNDLAQKLRQLPTEHNIDEVTLHIESDANTARAPSDIAALIVKPKGVAKATPRTLVIYPHNDAFLQDHPTKAGQQGYFIPFNSSLWDVVTCPLLTIGGTKDQGWGMADSGRQENFGTVTEHARFRLLVPELKADATGKFERNADGSAILDPRWFAKTQTGLLFPFSRISCLGKLASQWMIDQWIRREERDLDWARKNQLLLTRGGAGDTATANTTPVTGQQPTAAKIVIPASLYGSSKFLKDQTFNGLCLTRKLGNPLLFLTFTCNPKWPEIVSLLLPGQTAMDNPELTARVFHLKLDALLERLKAGLVFKRQSTRGTSIQKSVYLEMVSEDGHGYLIVVIEYQKRGLHHAHIAYRPARSPANKRLPTGEEVPWVDNMVCAQYPSKRNKQDIMQRFDLTEDEFAKLKVIVKKTMLHDNGKQHQRPNDPSEKIWCHYETGKCKQFYPKPYDPSQTCTFVDEKGFCVYKRTHIKDSWVVPYNPRLLLDFDCHFNVEISGTVNVITYLYKYFYKGPDSTKVFLDKYHADKPDEKDAIKEMRIMRYLCASEVATRILELRMYMTEPGVTSIPVHLPIAPNVPRKGASMLETYINRPSAPIFDDVPLSGKDAPNGDYVPGLWEVYIVKTDQPEQTSINNRKKVDPSSRRRQVVR